uniref:NADH dehydrogenase subunit 6 n=1 Tax=Pseudocellus gertschi TaxID=1329481 RepID=W5R4F9_9ARAC|nr:NADH dehydrogenase subunit 6 [Pseudocellus gertschi]AGL11941.1 NADH dehydrogenase subunit 6 [Pseudocellus gertschi]
MTINSMLSTIFASTKHPVLMIIILMLFTITTSMKTFMIHNNAWYSYTILLIMIGGMMVIFIYMTSTTPNKMFKMSPLIFISLIAMFNLMPTEKTPSWSQNIKTNPILEFSTNLNTILLTLYLLLTLIIINKSTSHYEGPMRSYN